MKKEYISPSAFKTRKFAEKFAKQILKQKTLQTEAAAVICLCGELGSGKTTFLQGFAKGLGVKEKILSPTFIIMRKFKNFFHFDCYRIENPKEILSLGFKEIINNPSNIISIEWADRIKKILPPKKYEIKFQILGRNKRKIKITETRPL